MKIYINVSYEEFLASIILFIILLFSILIARFFARYSIPQCKTLEII